MWIIPTAFRQFMTTQQLSPREIKFVEHGQELLDSLKQAALALTDYEHLPTGECGSYTNIVRNARTVISKVENI